MLSSEHNSHVDGLVQERRNSSALAMELHLSCTNPSMWITVQWYYSKVSFSPNTAAAGESTLWIYTLIARLMGPTLGPSGADRTQVGPMLAPWTLLSGHLRIIVDQIWQFSQICYHYALLYILLWNVNLLLCHIDMDCQRRHLKWHDHGLIDHRMSYFILQIKRMQSKFGFP